MAEYVFTSEKDIQDFKAANQTLSNFDVIIHNQIPSFIMEVLLTKYFPTFTYQSINVGTDLYAIYGHSCTLVVEK